MLTWLVTDRHRQVAVFNSTHAQDCHKRSTTSQAPFLPPQLAETAHTGAGTRSTFTGLPAHTHSQIPMYQHGPSNSPAQVPSPLTCPAGLHSPAAPAGGLLADDRLTRFGEMHTLFPPAADGGHALFLPQGFGHQVPSKSRKAPVAGTRTPTGCRAPTPLV